MNVNAFLDRPFVAESPVEVVTGSSVTFRITFWDDVTSPSAKAYKNGTDVSATVFPAGSVTASGKIVTLKPLTALVGNARYIIAVTVTVQSDVVLRKIEVITSKAEGEQ